jgi:dsRNA-specific ribonuclease
MMSTKVLADVIEALIGASHIAGGMDMALKCIDLLVPDIKWYDLTAGRLALSSIRPPTVELPATLVPLESLIGYTFANKSLLVEAVTHASYNAGSSTDASLECLEFLGDAILDSIIMPKLWESDRPHKIMTILRAACVNADLLGFLGMEWAISQQSTEVVDGTPIDSHVEFPFWSFMRHSSPAIGAEQKATQERHLQERQGILDAIHHSSTYPWALLAHLDICKFYSDIFESVLGAVWVDSGSMEVCEGLVERIGILPYLRRMLANNVDVAHPKNRLGEFIGAKTLRYEVSREEAPTAYLTCKVFVADEFIVEVGRGIHKDEVIIRAAEAAYDLLKNGAVMDFD